MRLRFVAALAMTFLPVATEPVNEILSMPGCAVIQRTEVIAARRAH